MSLWSPTFCLGHGDDYKPSKLLTKALMAYNGPVPPLLIERPLQLFLRNVISKTGSYLSDYFVRKLYGNTGDQVTIDGRYSKAFLVSLSSRELAQRSQSAMKGGMHHYNFMNSRQNLIAYGTVAAPRYDLSRIKLESITIWVGHTDTVISVSDISALMRDFTGNSCNRGVERYI